jgi:hypothetical protein
MNNKILFIGICTLSILVINCTKSIVKKETTIASSAVESDQYTELNQRVRKAGTINTPVELIKYYYGEIDADQDIDISVDQVEENQYEIILIQENIKDDSITEMRIIMVANNDNNQWTVLDIQRTWKCQKRRGHSKFSSN